MLLGNSSSTLIHPIDFLTTNQRFDGGAIITNPPFKYARERKDRFVAFHTYRKWVTIGDNELHLQVKAGELDNGLLEAGDGLIAYSIKDVGLFDGFSIKNSTKSTPHWQNAQLSGEALGATADNNNLFDDLGQDDYVFLEILELRPIGVSVNDQNNAPSFNSKEITEPYELGVDTKDGILNPPSWKIASNDLLAIAFRGDVVMYFEVVGIEGQAFGGHYGVKYLLNKRDDLAYLFGD